MKINSSYLFAILAVVGIGVWFWVNSGDDSNATAPVITPAQTERSAPTVVVERREATEHQNSFKLFGRTEANREVAVKAETAGLVISTPVTEGRRIAKGTVLCRQDVDARQANVDQALANLKAREFDLNSTQTLVDKGFRSAIQLQSEKAALDGAIAAVKQAEIELDNVNMRAPFSGVFDSQMAEVGDYLAPGQPCGNLIELNPLIVVVELTETQIGKIKLGQTASIDLVTGESVTGTIRFIEAKANSSTRTFRTEIDVPNPNYTLKGGVTATVSVKAGTTMAQHVPSKILALGDDGSVGVRYVDSQDRVGFANVTQIDEDEDGIWVTGLPKSTRIIIEGQDYVSVGTAVEPKAAIYGNTAERATQ